jgi:hypothetical protein
MGLLQLTHEANGAGWRIKLTGGPTLKGHTLEIFVSWVFTQIRPVG